MVFHYTKNCHSHQEAASSLPRANKHDMIINSSRAFLLHTWTQEIFAILWLSLLENSLTNCSESECVHRKHYFGKAFVVQKAVHGAPNLPSRVSPSNYFIVLSAGNFFIGMCCNSSVLKEPKCQERKRRYSAGV